MVEGRGVSTERRRLVSRPTRYSTDVYYVLRRVRTMYGERYSVRVLRKVRSKVVLAPPPLATGDLYDGWLL